MNQKNISISILDAEDKEQAIKDLNKANENIKTIKVKDKFNNIIHFDVMDEKFVPNLGVDLSYIKIAKEYNFITDVHLMVQAPIEDGYIDTAISYGADIITVHYEIDNFEYVLEYLNKKGVKVGVAIKPNTKVSELIKYKDKIDVILLMTVEPGYGGQRYIEEVNKKIKEVNKLFDNKIIQIDGGVNKDTIRFGLETGISSFVIGNAIIKSNDYTSTLIKFNIIKQIEESPKKKDKSFDEMTLMIKDGGYGENDTLIGIAVPYTRKIAKSWYKYVNQEIIEFFLSSIYHEYRRIGIFLMSNISKNNKNNLKILKNMNDILLSNVERIDNWDLTDEVGPNVLGIYLMLLDEKNRKKVLDEYLSSKNVWKKRIGIVSLLTFARNSYTNFCLSECGKNLYELHHLHQKATGWVLREVYKKDKKKLVEFLKENNKLKKLPNILLSYACEKMSKDEKNYIKDK